MLLFVYLAFHNGWFG